MRVLVWWWIGGEVKRVNVVIVEGKWVVIVLLKVSALEVERPEERMGKRRKRRE